MLKKSNIYIIFVFALGFLIYYLIVFNEIQFDIKGHIEILTTYIKNDSIPFPPFYYLSVYALSGFNVDISALYYSSIFALSVMLVIKYKATIKLLNYVINNNPNKTLIHHLAVALLIIMPIITGFNMYLGKPSPNVWHNSTIMFVMPFSVLLFLYTAKLISYKINRNTIFIFFTLIITNILIKPSYLFVFIFLPAIYYLFYGFDKRFIIFLIGSIVALVLIYIETQYIFYSEKDMIQIPSNYKKNEIIIAPFRVWRFYTNIRIIPLYFISGCAFPLAYLLFNLKKLKSNFLFTFSWLLFIGSILIFILFAESGYRMYDGNFYWQIVPSLYILFAISISMFIDSIPFELKKISNFLKLNRKNQLLLILFLLHFISGVGYLLKLLIFKSYI